MLIRLASVALALSASLSAADPVREVFYRGAVWPGGRFPFVERGYLVYISSATRVIVHGPDGFRRFDIDVRAPNQEDLRVTGFAVDGDGTAAAAIQYGPLYSQRGALVFFDAAGEQTRFVDIYPYILNAICFSEAHFIWGFGTPHVLKGEPGESPQDPKTLLKFTNDGRVVGEYLPVSSLLGGFSVENMFTQGIRLAADRVGLIGTFSVSGGGQSNWWLLETDLGGKTVNRWPLGAGGAAGALPKGGIAYTDYHGLYALQSVVKERIQRLVLYDRESSSWKPANDEKYPLGYRLLGAEGNDLVIQDRSIDPTLKWFPAP